MRKGLQVRTITSTTTASSSSSSSQQSSAPGSGSSGSSQQSSAPSSSSSQQNSAPSSGSSSSQQSSAGYLLGSLTCSECKTCACLGISLRNAAILVCRNRHSSSGSMMRHSSQGRGGMPAPLSSP